MKKLKKLTLKKETITNLSKSEQSLIHGGGDTWDLACAYSALIMMGYCSAVGGGGCVTPAPKEPETINGKMEPLCQGYTLNITCQYCATPTPIPPFTS